MIINDRITLKGVGAVLNLKVEKYSCNDVTENRLAMWVDGKEEPEHRCYLPRERALDFVSWLERIISPDCINIHFAKVFSGWAVILDGSNTWFDSLPPDRYLIFETGSGSNDDNFSDAYHYFGAQAIPFYEKANCMSGPQWPCYKINFSWGARDPKLSPNEQKWEDELPRQINLICDFDEIRILIKLLWGFINNCPIYDAFDQIYERLQELSHTAKNIK